MSRPRPIKNRRPPARTPAVSFTKVVRALGLVSPTAILSHIPDEPRCALEACVSGAAALRMFGIDARVVPACLFAQKGTDLVMVGLTDGDVDALRTAFGLHGTTLTINGAVPSEDEPRHYVIEARSGNQYAMLDLTMGQLREFGIPSPLYGISFREDWGGASIDGWEVRHHDHPQPAVANGVLASLAPMVGPGLAVDMVTLMGVALALDLDPERFLQAVQEADPALSDRVSRALDARRLPTHH